MEKQGSKGPEHGCIVRAEHREGKPPHQRGSHGHKQNRGKLKGVPRSDATCKDGKSQSVGFLAPHQDLGRGVSTGSVEDPRPRLGYRESERGSRKDKCSLFYQNHITRKRRRFISDLKKHQDQERLEVSCCQLVVYDVDVRVFLWGCLQRDRRKVWTSEARTR